MPDGTDPGREDYVLAVLSATPQETAGLRDLMKAVVTTRAAGFTVHTGTLSGKRIAVSAVGEDGDTVARATEAVVAAYHPQLIVAAGFVTGLAEGIRRSDLVIAQRIVDDAGQRVALDLSAATSAGVHVGTVATVPTWPAGPSARKQLGQTHAALAADRIAMPVALTCQQEQTPMMAVGVVTTAVDDAPSREVAHLMRQQSLAGKAGALLGGMVRRPSTARDLWQMKEATWQASDRLARCLAGLLAGNE